MAKNMRRSLTLNESTSESQDRFTNQPLASDYLNENMPESLQMGTQSAPNIDIEAGSSSESEDEAIPECAVCLQSCMHPVQLPCQHIFCFLCVKGAANQSKRCALCRSEIPVDFLNNPSLMRKKDLLKDHGFEDGYQWFYEGKNGWWQYDKRTSSELEERYKNNVKFFDLLIAGFLYVIDLEGMIQVRRNDPTRRRRIKRDLKDVPKKGVAGIKLLENLRNGTDGCESESSKDQFAVNAATMPFSTRLVDQSPDGQNMGQTTPSPPSNTPQSLSENPSPDQGTTENASPLMSRMTNLSIQSDEQDLVYSSNNVRPHAESPSTSDSDWE